MARLTAASVKAWKPTMERQQVPDDLCVGLYLMVQPTGRKSWTVRYRVGTKHRRYSVGKYPLIGLSEARDKSREILKAVQEGKDPSAEQEQAKADTVRAVVAEFDRFHLSKLKSGKNAMGFLERSIVAEWGDRPLRDITKRDVSRLLLAIVESGREVTANRTFAHVRKFFNWCAENGYIEHPPTDRMKMPVDEKSRERVLSADEIRWFWQACGKEGQPWGHLGKLLLLTGCRLAEVANMTDAEIDGGVWKIPASRTKNGRPHDVPLSDAALDVLADVKRIGDSGYIFTTNGKTPVQGFHKARQHIADAMQTIADAEHGKSFDIPHWTFHDLRRTLETEMARMGVPETLIDRLTNHLSAIPKMRRVYQHYDYLDEKRGALECWAVRIDELSRYQLKSVENSQ